MIPFLSPFAHPWAVLPWMQAADPRTARRAKTLRTADARGYQRGPANDNAKPRRTR